MAPESNWQAELEGTEDGLPGLAVGCETAAVSIISVSASTSGCLLTEGAVLRIEKLLDLSHTGLDDDRIAPI